MSPTGPAPGLLVWVELGARQPQGHEQEGRRPCVVVAVPGTVHPLRFPVLPVLPLYPRLSRGMGGLGADGTVLLDQLLAVDVHRVKKQIGQLAPADYAPIKDGLRAMFGF